MKINTNQSLIFADTFVTVPQTDWDKISALLDELKLPKMLAGVGIDYDPNPCFELY